MKEVKCIRLVPLGHTRVTLGALDCMEQLPPVELSRSSWSSWPAHDWWRHGPWPRGHEPSSWRWCRSIRWLGGVEHALEPAVDPPADSVAVAYPDSWFIDSMDVSMSLPLSSMTSSRTWVMWSECCKFKISPVSGIAVCHKSVPGWFVAVAFVVCTREGWPVATFAAVVWLGSTWWWKWWACEWWRCEWWCEWWSEWSNSWLGSLVPLLLLPNMLTWPSWAREFMSSRVPLPSPLSVRSQWSVIIAPPKLPPGPMPTPMAPPPPHGPPTELALPAMPELEAAAAAAAAAAVSCSIVWLISASDPPINSSNCNLHHIQEKDTSKGHGYSGEGKKRTRKKWLIIFQCE